MIDWDKTQEDYYVRPKTDVTLSVIAETLNPPLTYQWYQKTGNGFELLPNETNATLKLFNVTKNGTYKCVVKDGSGASDEVWSYVYMDSGLEIEWNRDRIYVKPGEEATLSVKASSRMEDAEFTYVWYYIDWDEMESFVKIPDATQSTLVVKPEKFYEYLCGVSDSYTTKTANFTVSVDSGLSVAENQIMKTVKTR